MSAISAEEFFQAFQRSVGFTSATQFNHFTHMCIAVSGGLDSMALVFLCHRLGKLREKDGGRPLHIDALIVDHQVRHNSCAEVINTKSRLSRLGVRPKIIRLEWPSPISPSNQLYFEGKARRLRYRALGKACVRLKHHSLFLGHHENDQAETILMNLAASQDGRTMRKMTPRALIPECEGIHGVDQSGSFDRNLKRLSLMKHGNMQEQNPEKYARLQRSVRKPPIFESGGMDILRPLLRFSKERLRQTCKENHIEWEEDESNHDVRVTPRNAIRNLLTNCRLPRALRTSNLLQIGSQRSTKIIRFTQEASRNFEGCEILKLDVRSGVLVIRLPLFVLPQASSYSLAIAKILLRTIAEPVAPRLTRSSNLDIHSHCVKTLFSSLQDPNAHSTGSGTKVSSFTAEGIHFLRQSLKRSPNSLDGKPNQIYDDGLDPEFVWQLSRQPFSDTSRPKSNSFLPESSVKFWEFTQKSVWKEQGLPPWLKQEQDHPWCWSAWQLWDGRFWIRSRHAPTRTFILRTCWEHEMSAIRNRVSSSAYRRFRDALHDAAPGKIRWTLPVIAEIENVKNQAENINTLTKDGASFSPNISEAEQEPHGKIVAFPTLGTAGWLDILDEHGNHRLDWELRYKRVSLRRRDDRGQLFGSDPRTVIAWDDGGQGEQTATHPDWNHDQYIRTKQG